MKNKIASSKKLKVAKKPVLTKGVKNVKTINKSGKTGLGANTPKKSPSQASPKDQLIKQLQTLTKDLNESSIRFLIQQAQVLASKTNAGSTVKEQRKSEIVEQISKKGTLSNKYTIDVKEADDKSHFIIIINSARNFFTLEEMRKLVRLCHSSSGEMDASRRLFNWLSQFRKDVIIDTKIDGPSDLALSTIYKYLIKNYTVKAGS